MVRRPALSEEAWKKLIEAGVVDPSSQEVTNIVFIGCGGVRVKPESVMDLEIEVYGCRVSVPTFLVKN